MQLAMSQTSPTYEQPPFLKLEQYEDVVDIRKQFVPLGQVNVSGRQFDNLDNSLFFVIRTQGEDNVHRAMKYGIWTSSSRKNHRLSQAFNQTQTAGGDVYLFFTEINSLCFSGVAKLTSDFDPKAHFKYWLMENKWFGSFKIEWLYVKDVSFSLFEELKQIQKLDGSEETLKCVYDLIDCTELSLDNGKLMIQIFQQDEGKKSLFEDFSELDVLEQKCRLERQNNNHFERKFAELTRVFEQIPFSFSVASYERKKMQRKMNYYNQQSYYYNNPYMQFYNQQPGGYQYGGYQQQQQYPNYYQQPQQYWQQNNGFYQKQHNYQPRGGPNDQQQPREQQQHYEEDPGLKDVPLQNRFQFRNKKAKFEKRPPGNSGGGHQGGYHGGGYYKKQHQHGGPHRQQYQQDTQSNYQNYHEEESEEEVVQQQQ